MKDDTASLSLLRDIIEPTAITLWPPAPAPAGWLLLALLLVWLITLIVIAVLHYRSNAYRRDAIKVLDDIRSSASTDECHSKDVLRLAELLKRVAISVYPRQQVASLAGDPWLKFLDSSGGDGAFDSATGRWLTRATYQPGIISELADDEWQKLLLSCRHWIMNHRKQIQ
ncbi:MAG: hypothetical protein DHS20C01_08730 [marine bacterium B5-7]|nr:MAG: hypothetical protein DHS20C01_08730 [marine bacterium B5-7]